MNKKKNTKRIISLACIVAVVALLAAMPLIAKQDLNEDGPKASILSGSVSAGSIHTELIGGGALAQEDAVTVSVPSAVKLTGFLVSNGQTVTEGTPIATVDRVTVMTAIEQVQETLEYLSEQIEDASDTDSEESVTALAGGTVKLLYAEEGDSVQDVMLAHGALAVLSLDGLMAVDLETDSDLSAGTAVTVTLSNGTEVSGKVARNLAGEMTVTLEDEGYAVEEPVQVTAQDGTAVGSGALYIYSPWNATAYAGTVDRVKVSVGDELSAGKTLMVLEDVGYSATYRQLISQRQEYEELMLELFQMYQTQTLTAPCDGVVSGVDESSAQLLSAGSGGFTLQLLANAPNGDDQTEYINFVGQVSTVTAEGIGLMLNPTPISVTDYKDLSLIPTDPSAMTQTVSYGANAPVYALAGGEWVQIGNGSLNPGDILLFACDSSGSFVWVVRLIAAAPSQPEDTPTPDEPADDPTVPTDPMDPTVPTDPSTPTEPGDPGTSGDPTVPGDSTVPGGTGDPGASYPSGGMTGGMSGGMMGGMMGGMTQQEEEFELYGLDMTQIAEVTPQDTMTLEITVDELDITALQVGMTAQVKIDALGGEKHTATITEIGNTGESNGGNSKFTVELTMDRSGNMLPGMNATATVVLSSVNDVLTIPADALVENGNQTVVYTGYDEENDLLLDPVTVRIGCSDGETVEILEGLSEGQTYYYPYYDTLEISFTPDFGGGGFMFG